jgi:hypothetical protein
MGWPNGFIEWLKARFPRHTMLIGEEHEPQTWFMSAVGSPSDWDYQDDSGEADAPTIIPKDN